MNLQPSDYDRTIESVILSKSIRDAISNTLLYGAIALGALWLGGYWPLLGKIVCVLYGLLLAIEIVRHLVSFFTIGLAAIGKPSSGDREMILALVVQVLETAAFAFLFWLLLRRFFLV